MTSNIYLDLTNEFNEGRLRAILAGDWALVAHGIFAPGGVGDWIVRQEEESLAHILGVLEQHGARYRLGAPLDVRWMRGGWSSHFEFLRGTTRIRCDFVSRPPRVGALDLALMWHEQEDETARELEVPTVDRRRLAALKATQRERDYSFIGELARRMPDLRDQILWSRSARDLIELAGQHPQEIENLASQRPLLAEIPNGRRALERALDEERRDMLEADETRMASYLRAARSWNEAWKTLGPQLTGLPLRQSHQRLCQAAENLLPERL